MNCRVLLAIAVNRPYCEPADGWQTIVTVRIPIKTDGPDFQSGSGQWNI
jgi:hypothetical protein